MNLIWVYENSYIQYQHLNLLKMKKILLLGILLITSITNAQTNSKFLKTTVRVAVEDIQTGDEFELENKYYVYFNQNKIEITDDATKETKVVTGLKFQSTTYQDNNIFDLYIAPDNRLSIVIAMSSDKNVLFVLVRSKNASLIYVF